MPTTIIRATIRSRISVPSAFKEKVFPNIERSPTAGARASISHVKGINNIKAGISYEQTFLNENDHLGIVDPTFNAPCLTTEYESTNRRILPSSSGTGIYQSEPVRGSGR